ncbi:MAG: hypothetical protein Q4Q25_04345, partial [Methanocorpusculum sp.]|nr:hypothetical protein [Methanocorpusculum sp.]
KGAINVENAGYYDISLLTTGVNASVSAAILYIDGAATIYTSANGVPKGTICEPSYPQEKASVFNIFEHKSENAVYLTSGTHEVKLTYKPSTGSGTGNVVKYALDCIKVLPHNGDVEYTSDLVDYADAPFYVEEGIEQEPWLINVYLDGETIENGDTYQITYDSSNENVLTFDADGYLTPVEPGYSDLSIVVAISGHTVATFNERVFVLADGLNKYIKNASFADGYVSFDTIMMNSEYEESGYDASVLVAEYEGNKMVNAEIVSVTSANTTYNVAFDADSNNDIKIYVWDADVFSKPLWFVTEVK